MNRYSLEFFDLSELQKIEVMLDEIDSINERFEQLENRFNNVFGVRYSESTVKPEDLHEDAKSFWKNNQNSYPANVGQVTGLLADYGAYLLNKERNKK